MSDDLMAFLRARLDEDESTALAADGDAIEATPLYEGAAYLTLRGDHKDRYTGELPATLADHAARHDPARVLREVEAKRRILDEHQPDHLGDCVTCAGEETFDDDYDGNRTWSRSAKSHPCPTLRLLALPHANHPDYRNEWTP